MYVEAKRAGRDKEFYVFHLGWPEISARYNAVGRFGRISEVASRIAGQLSGEGNSAAFREFAWRFVNIIARALIELGRRPDYLQIQRHVVNIDALFIEYAQQFFAKTDPQAWESLSNSKANSTRRTFLGIWSDAKNAWWPSNNTWRRNGSLIRCWMVALGSALRPHLLRQNRCLTAAAAGETHHR
jgi:hypothetical protein